MSFPLKPLARQLSLLFAFHSVAAFAEDGETLEPIVVSATRHPTALENVPGQVEVVTAKELAKRNVNRLTDALNLVPGLALQPGRGPLQGGQSFSLRGVPDDRRVQVVVDGVAINDGYAGSVNLAALPSGMVDQVEVLVGPASSLYGGNAMGGVVSYTTRMPKADQFSFSAGYGDPFSSGKAASDLRRVALSTGTLFSNDLSVLFGASWMATDGYRNDYVVATSSPGATLTGWSPTQQKSGAAGYLIGDKGRTEWEENGEYLRLEQRISGANRWRASWSRQAYVLNSVDPQTYLRSATTGVPQWTCCSGGITQYSFLSTSAGAYERNTYSVGADFELGDGLLKITASYADTPKNFTVSPMTTPVSATLDGGSGRSLNTTSNTRVLDAFWYGPLGDSHSLTVGGALRADRAVAEDYTLSNWRDPETRTALYATASGQTHTTGLYVQDEWELDARWKAYFGLRYDYWSNENGSVATPGWTSGKIFKEYESRHADALSPKLALRYQVSPGASLRMSYGSAFRAPSVYELYRSTKIGSTTYSANPDLKPETIDTLDFGADLRPWQGGELKLTLFANRMHDLIYTEGGSSTTKTRINAEQAESRGFTLGFVQALGSSARLFSSYTQTNSEVTQNSRVPASVGKQLTMLPKHQATLGIEGDRGPWSLGANVRYASKQYASDDNTDTPNQVPQVYDPYVLTDLKLSYRFDKHFTASLAIDNVFDREYFSFYQAPGRSWFASVKYDY